MSRTKREQDYRLLFLSLGSCLLGLMMAFCAKAILWLIAAITNLAFYGRLSAAPVSPALHHLGLWVIAVPVTGGIIIGLMARYGSRAIQGHGIPEAMEQVLLNESRIPPRILALKPLSTCVVIGTGGPFGAEGVVIATGGALGSFISQFLPTSPLDRKILLAAGAAAGLSATFNAPISAVLLAVELLLFEFHPRSLIPVSLASASAAAMRQTVLGSGPMFAIPPIAIPAAASLAGYLVLGLFIGLLSVVVVRSVYWMEKKFEHIPIHWMWKPALGALGIGILGFAEPRIFGPGYEVITAVLSGDFAYATVTHLGVLKLLAWAIGVASATSSGTLAPLFLIGAGAGSIIAHCIGWIFPKLLDPRMAALVGMAAFFGGMSGAFLASVVMAIEVTYQLSALMPLLAACAAANLVCRLLAGENIMTQKFVRQGVAVPPGYTASPLDWLHVTELASSPVVALDSNQTIEQTRQWLASKAEGTHHQRYPVVNTKNHFVGWTSRWSIMDSRHSPQQPIKDIVERTSAVILENAVLREAVWQMISLDTAVLAILSSTEPQKIVGTLTRKDVLAAHRHEEEGFGFSRTHKLKFSSHHEAPHQHSS